MRVSRMSCIPLAIVAFAAAPLPLWAQQLSQAQQSQQADPAAAETLRQAMAQLRADFEARMAALEARLNAVTGGAVPAEPSAGAVPATAAGVQATPGAAGAGDSSGLLAASGGASAASKVFNPDMAVIGNFLGATGRNRVNPGPTLQMQESEASFQAVVDPYARADFFLSFGETGVDLEEGFITFPALPGGLLVKVGKMRASFGKVNASHTHILPWTDRPLVTTNLVGGDEGIADAGISVARLIPNPWFFLEATGQVFRGDSGDVFRSSKRSDVSVVGRLRGYQDISESTNLDVGASYSRGHNASANSCGPGCVVLLTTQDIRGFKAELFDLDATLRWKPLQRSIYHSFIARAEGVLSRREQQNGRQHARGFFVSGDYQVARRWFTGVRYDASERVNDPSARDTGGSLVLTYRPSEFSQVRGQLRRTNFAEGLTANEVLFQFQFAIGAHGAHPF